MNLFHFYLLRSVGKGAFGKVSSGVCQASRLGNTPLKRRRSRWQARLRMQVRVVQHKHTKTLFALKYINKAKCVKMKAVANIVQERRLLEEVSLASDHLLLRIYSIKFIRHSF